MSLKLRSYTLQQLMIAQRNGETLWALDTANFGEDDTLIASTREEAETDALNHHELDEFPSDWSIDKIDYLITETDNEGDDLDLDITFSPELLASQEKLRAEIANRPKPATHWVGDFGYEDEAGTDDWPVSIG